VRTAVDRLWQALGAGDWRAMAHQLHRGAEIWLSDGGVTVDREEYVARRRGAGPAAVHVEHHVQQRNVAAIEVSVARGSVVRRCAGFYDLRDGRISRGAEYWGPEGPPTQAHGAGAR
jgi:ketosteroid isomerase-like protein